MKEALIIIDLQNDYFLGGKYPLWNTETVLDNVKLAINKANKKNVPIVFIQHIAPKEAGLSPFFNEGTEGANIHSELLALAPEAKIVKKIFADGFHQTNLEEVLTELQTEKIVICGMMTQNCVTHTALSKQAEKYKMTLLPECCTTVEEMLHMIALHAISTRVDFETLETVFE